MQTNLLGLLAALTSAPLSAQPAGSVAHVTLDCNLVYHVQVALDRVTTVSLPGPIAGLEGAFISQEPSLLTRFQLSFQPGSSYFSLRALATNVTANLNVILGREVYALELVESRQPVYVLDFARPVPDRPAPLPALAAPQPVRLPATIETAKNYARLLSENPEAARPIHYARPNQTTDYPEYAVRVEEAFRFEAEDTLILRIAARNKTGTVISLVPAKSGVWVGGREYPASRFDGSATLPVGTEVQIYLMFTDAPNGGRYNLAVNSAFAVFLGRYESPAPWQAVVKSYPAPAYVVPQSFAQPTAYRPVAYQPAYPAYSERSANYSNTRASQRRFSTTGIHLGLSIGTSSCGNARQTAAFR